MNPQVAVERRRDYAVGGIVRVLCSTRMLVLVLAVAEALLDGGGGLFVLVALAAAPFSFVPALNWNTRGPLYFRKGYLLAADIVVSAGVLVDLHGVSLMAVFGGATVALWGVTTGMRVASLMAVPVAVLVVPWSELGDGWRHVTGGLVSVAAVFAMVWAGKVLGDGVRKQQMMVAELELERAEHAAADERLRIARDLHDTVAGDLAGATLLVQGLRVRIERGETGPGTADLGRTLEDAVVTAHRHTRSALDELRTVRDLRSELEAVLDRWTHMTGITPRVRFEGRFDDVAGQTGQDVRAVLGELLENVRKHAGASQVWVEVTVADGGREVVVVVDDDGQGTTPTVASGGGHYGVQGIRERAGAAGGSARWEVSALGGTRAHVTLRTAEVTGALDPVDVPQRVAS
jgi:two-component system sensor histidine kinase UhpB